MNRSFVVAGAITVAWWAGLLRPQLCEAQKILASPWPVHELKTRAERADFSRRIQEKRNEWSLRENSALARRVQKLAEKGAKARVETILSPDRKKFLRITGYVPSDSYHAGIYEAHSGKLLRQLPSLPPDEECGGAMDGEWSPDGKFVAFSQVENESRLYFDVCTGREVAGSGPRAIFAPDSKHIADLYSEAQTNKYRVVLRPLRGRQQAGYSAVIPIRDNPVPLCFSRDGKRLFLRGSGDSSDRFFSVRVR